LHRNVGLLLAVVAHCTLTSTLPHQLLAARELSWGWGSFGLVGAEALASLLAGELSRADCFLHGWTELVRHI
jgi:hypothetical protein